jgi:hypothetical protein
MSNKIARSVGVGFIAWWIFCILFGLASSAAVIYVAWHFLAKFW